MVENEIKFQREGDITGQWDFLRSYESLFRKSSLILILFLGRNYTTKFHVRDLARLLQYDVSLISKNLKQLEKMGFVIHEEVGNLVFYQADMNNVLTRQMKICFTLLELHDLIRDLDHLTTNLILYGSCAKGEDTYRSDIDLYIETPDKKVVSDILNKHRKKMIRELSPIMNTPDETYTLKREDKSLYDHIQEGILLKGGEHVP